LPLCSPPCPLNAATSKILVPPIATRLSVLKKKLAISISQTATSTNASRQCDFEVQFVSVISTDCLSVNTPSSVGDRAFPAIADLVLVARKNYRATSRPRPRSSFSEVARRLIYARSKVTPFCMYNIYRHHVGGIPCCGRVTLQTCKLSCVELTHVDVRGLQTTVA